MSNNMDVSVGALSELFLMGSILEMIATNTNAYARSKERAIKDITKVEVLYFLLLLSTWV